MSTPKPAHQQASQQAASSQGPAAPSGHNPTRQREDEGERQGQRDLLFPRLWTSWAD